MTHQLITEILFLSKEKTGLKYPIKERMEGNLLLLIYRGSSFEVLQSNTFLCYNRAPLTMLLANILHFWGVLLLDRWDLAPKTGRGGPVPITVMKQQGLNPFSIAEASFRQSIYSRDRPDIIQSRHICWIKSLSFIVGLSLCLCFCLSLSFEQRDLNNSGCHGFVQVIIPMCTALAGLGRVLLIPSLSLDRAIIVMQQRIRIESFPRCWVLVLWYEMTLIICSGGFVVIRMKLNSERKVVMATHINENQATKEEKEPSVILTLLSQQLPRAIPFSCWTGSNLTQTGSEGNILGGLIIRARCSPRGHHDIEGKYVFAPADEWFKHENSHRI